MIRGDEKITVSMNDSSHPKERKETGIATASPVPAKTGRVSASVTQPSRERIKPPKKEKKEPQSKDDRKAQKQAEKLQKQLEKQNRRGLIK
jgi:hypothetical protein